MNETSKKLGTHIENHHHQIIIIIFLNILLFFLFSFLILFPHFHKKQKHIWKLKNHFFLIYPPKFMNLFCYIYPSLINSSKIFISSQTLSISLSFFEHSKTLSVSNFRFKNVWTELYRVRLCSS